MTTARDIGIDVTPPEGVCEDPNCPFHGKLSVRGQILEGSVVSTRPERSVVVRRQHLNLVPKYDRFEKRTSRTTAHLPPCISTSLGDEVTIMECRPISKTKQFVVVEARSGRPDILVEDYTEMEDLEIPPPETSDEDEEEEAVHEAADEATDEGAEDASEDAPETDPATPEPQ